MPLRKVKSGWMWGSKGPFATKEKALKVARAVYASGYKKSLLFKSLENLVKQYSSGSTLSDTYGCAIGFHKHASYPYCHPVERHHRHRGEIAGTNWEFTVPEPQSVEEAEEEESFGSGVTVTDIARAHDVRPDTLRRALAKFSGIKEGSGEGAGAEVYREYYDPETERFMKIKIRELRPSDVRVAHILAANIKRSMESRNRPVHSGRV